MSLERRNYRKVYQRLWKNPSFRRLTDSLKVMTLYVLTGPQSNRVGLYQFSFGQAAEDLAATIPVAKSRLVSVCKTFGWEFDDVAQVVWIPSWWVFNPVSENEKNLKGYLTDLNDVPRTRLAPRFCQNLDEIPHPLQSLITPWLAALTPSTGHPFTGQHSDGQHIGRSPTNADHVADGITDPITDRTTETETVTETQTHTRARAPAASLHDRFEDFWQAYPKRVGKGVARKCWEKLAPDDALTAVILGALDKQKRSRQWREEDGRYIPHPSTWLNQERWQDELTTAIALGQMAAAPAGCQHRPACRDEAQHTARRTAERKQVPQ